MRPNIVFITENGLARGGKFNGYVAIPPEHPMYGLHYDVLNALDISVHGGLTYGRKAGTLDWRNQPANTDDYWIFGFDTVHCDDTAEMWPPEKVMNEAVRLAEQIQTLPPLTKAQKIVAKMIGRDLISSWCFSYAVEFLEKELKP